MPGIEEFVESENLPAGEVRIAAFDGENADPANGRLMEPGLRAFTPWGELAYQLAGREGYELVKPSDVGRMAPGADTLRELFAGKPTLILLDELSVYLRKIASLPGAREQLTAFLTSLFKAIESSPNAVLVYTLAVGKDGKVADAYGAANTVTNTVTAYLLQQIQLSPTGTARAFLPGARRAIGLPSRRSSSVTKSAVPSGRPMPSASLNDMNFSSESSSNKTKKSASDQAQGAQSPSCPPRRQGGPAHSTTPIPRHETPGQYGDRANTATVCVLQKKIRVVKLRRR